MIPKSEPPPPPYRPPANRLELQRELRRLTGPEKVPPEFIPALARLVPGIFPKDFRLVSEFLQAHMELKNSQLNTAVLARMDELGRNMDIKSLLRLSEFYRSKRVIELLGRNVSADALVALTTKELIRVLALCGASRVVCAELGKRVKTVSWYESATIVNLLKKSIGHEKSGNFLLDAISTHFLKNLSSHSQTTKKPSPRDLALVMNAFVGRPELMDLLANECFDRFEEFSELQIPIVLHALGSNSRDLRLFDCWADFIVRNVQRFSSKALAMTAYAFAKNEVKNEAVLHAICEMAIRDLQTANFQSISLLMFSVSRLKFFHKPLLDQVAQELIFRATVKRDSKLKHLQFRLADVAMIAKAFANFRWTDDRVTFVLMEMLKRNGESADGPAIVRLVEAISKFDKKNRIEGKFKFWVSKALPPVLAQLRPAEVNSLLSSLVKLNIKNRTLFDLILAAVNIDTFDFRLIPQFLKLAAKLGIYDNRLVRNCSKLVSVHLASYSCSDLIDFLLALSGFNHRDEKMIARVSQALQFQLANEFVVTELSPGLVVSLLLSLTRLRVLDEHLYEKVFQVMFEKLPSLDSERLISNALFAIASGVGSNDVSATTNWLSGICAALLDQLVSSGTNLSFEGIRQIQVFNLFLQQQSTIEIRNVNALDF